MNVFNTDDVSEKGFKSIYLRVETDDYIVKEPLNHEN